MCSVYYTLYHGLAIYTELTFVNVHHAQMSTFVIEVCLWYIGFCLGVHPFSSPQFKL